MISSLSEQLSQVFVVSRLQDQIGEMLADLKNNANQRVVDMGALAVGAGFSRDDVIDRTWGTILRHQRLMRTLDYHLFNEPSPREFSVVSSPIAVPSSPGDLMPDIGLSLVVEEQGLGAEGFKAFADEHSLDAAIDAYISPHSCKVEAIDLESGYSFTDATLAPRSFDAPDPDFRDEWHGQFYPFSNIPELRSAYERSRLRNRYEDSADSLTDKQLIVAAGLNERFNSVLDLVEMSMS